MLELSLIGHFTYRYIGRKYRDLSIYIDLFIIFLINVKHATYCFMLFLYLSDYNMPFPIFRSQQQECVLFDR